MKFEKFEKHYTGKRRCP